MLIRRVCVVAALALVSLVAMAAPSSASPAPDEGVLVDLGINGVRGLDLRRGANGGGIVSLTLAIGVHPLVSLGQPAPRTGERLPPITLPGLSLDLGGLLGR